MFYCYLLSQRSTQAACRTGISPHPLSIMCQFAEMKHFRLDHVRSVIGTYPERCACKQWYSFFGDSFLAGNFSSYLCRGWMAANCLVFSPVALLLSFSRVRILRTRSAMAVLRIKSSSSNCSFLSFVFISRASWPRILFSSMVMWNFISSSGSLNVRSVNLK